MPALILAHSGQPPAPHDLWGAWNADPLLLAVFLLSILAYRRGRARSRSGAVDRRSALAFTAAAVVLGIALVSPLDALSRALASAHMVQHILLVLVAAPLLAFSAPSVMLLRGSPLLLRRAAGRSRALLRLTSSNTSVFRHPGTAWLLHVAVLWFWHAAVPYNAALEHDFVHVLEHASFLVTGVMFWRIVIGGHHLARAARGLALLLVFAMAMQSVFLSALLTFSPTPWYSGYATTTIAWGLEPLVDQQLAGLIMWIPAGLIYVAMALFLLVAWIAPTASPGEGTSPRG